MQNILFSETQYTALRTNYEKWWNGLLNRPIVPIVTTGHDTVLQKTNAPLLQFTSAWDESVTPQMLIDAHTYDFSTQQWHGDAFPTFFTQKFGAGVMAAFLGCKPISAPNTVWFLPKHKDTPIDALHFEYDENNPYLRRVIAVVEEALERWNGQVVIGMPDLGGILDVMASFRGTENLLTDLYDDPDEVLRCIKELQDLWIRYFDQFASLMKQGNCPGFSHWYGLYSEVPSYILQSDFSYMISPEMFRTFVSWELASTSAHMGNAVYHLDGPGEIAHLDQILAIDSIQGIQWVPGAGAPSEENWDDLLKRILASGKKLLSWNQNPDGSPLTYATNLGQLYLPTRTYDVSEINLARRYADLYGIEVK